MTTLLALIIALSPGNTAPPTPEIPPPFPTYIVDGDGGRWNCTPNYSFCWPGENQRDYGHGW